MCWRVWKRVVAVVICCPPSRFVKVYGHCRNRTSDLVHAKHTRYQLRQAPMRCMPTNDLHPHNTPPKRNETKHNCHLQLRTHTYNTQTNKSIYVLYAATEDDCYTNRLPHQGCQPKGWGKKGSGQLADLNRMVLQFVVFHMTAGKKKFGTVHRETQLMDAFDHHSNQTWSLPSEVIGPSCCVGECLWYILSCFCTLQRHLCLIFNAFWRLHHVVGMYCIVLQGQEFGMKVAACYALMHHVVPLCLPMVLSWPSSACFICSRRRDNGNLPLLKRFKSSLPYLLFNELQDFSTAFNGLNRHHSRAAARSGSVSDIPQGSAW